MRTAAPSFATVVFRRWKRKGSGRKMNQTIPPSLVKTCDITKSFGSIYALNGVDFEIAAGQIVAIVGDNGSGKSTFIKILSGSLHPDQGSIFIDGVEHKSLNARQALQAGISTVYQDLSLDNYCDVAENIFLGNELTWGGIFLRRNKMRRIAQELIRDLDIGIPDITLPVGSFSGGQRQAVAVARSVYHGRRLIILDEPTAAMGVRESNAVLKLIARLARRGMAVIIICHNLHQVFTIADKVCIMRHGRIIRTTETADTSLQEVQQMIMEADLVD